MDRTESEADSMSSSKIAVTSFRLNSELQAGGADQVAEMNRRRCLQAGYQRLRHDSLDAKAQLASEAASAPTLCR